MEEISRLIWGPNFCRFLTKLEEEDKTRESFDRNQVMY